MAQAKTGDHVTVRLTGKLEAQGMGSAMNSKSQRPKITNAAERVPRTDSGLCEMQNARYGIEQSSVRREMVAAQTAPATGSLRPCVPAFRMTK